MIKTDGHVWQKVKHQTDQAWSIFHLNVEEHFPSMYFAIGLFPSLSLICKKGIKISNWGPLPGDATLDLGSTFVLYLFVKL